MIYADYAATHPLRDAAWKAMDDARRLCGNPSALHAAGREAKEALESARSTVAGLLGAHPREVIFTSGGSEANTTALRSAARLGAQAGKRHLLAAAIEHPSVLNTLRALADEGFEVELLPVSPEGYLQARDVAAALRADTALVAVMHANNEIGTIQPVREIAAICRERGVHIHTDAVQTVGQIPVHAGELGVDTLACSAHKFGGPRGVGVLYTRRGVMTTPLITGGHQERGLRAGTENLPGAVGMAAALEEAVGDMDARGARLRALSKSLEEEILAAFPWARRNGVPCGGGTAGSLPHLVSLTFDGLDGEALVYRLDALGICVSAGSACTAGSPDPSHVITALGVPPETALGTIRISLGEDHTEETVHRLAETVIRTVTALREI